MGDYRERKWAGTLLYEKASLRRNEEMDQITSVHFGQKYWIWERIRDFGFGKVFPLNWEERERSGRGGVGRSMEGRVE